MLEGAAVGLKMKALMYWCIDELSGEVTLPWSPVTHAPATGGRLRRDPA